MMSNASATAGSGLRYLSLFSGIGGLEHPTTPPLLFCERDEACRQILGRRHPGVDLRDSVETLKNPPSAEIVVGGWPCQDLSSAGTRGGIRGRRSGLFFEMLRIARESGADTIVGENVPNLLTMNGGRDFRTVLNALLTEGGYRFVSWRVLNARAFGLPQERRRLFIVASKERERAEALHAPLPPVPAPLAPSSAAQAYGFYWTAGRRSLCFSQGCAPTLKIGATDNNGRAPVAVMWRGRVRKLSPLEFLRLQGFDGLPTAGIASSAILRMAGNAVPVPMGRFVLAAVEAARPASLLKPAFAVITSAGIFDSGLEWAVDHQASPLAANLSDFLDESGEVLSPQAAAGLIVRSVRSGQPMPRELFALLADLARDRTRPLRPSRANSFDALDSMLDAVTAYGEALLSIPQYGSVHAPRGRR